jgi:phosphoesterase RecJ-like protein
VEQILKIFRENQNFTIGGHVSPDGDAIGSCFALALALEKMGKNVQVVLEPFARKYGIIPGRELLFFGDTKDIEAEIFVALDCADALRLGASQELFKRAKITVCIDHHETNCGFADFNLIEPAASSTSEMTFKVIEQLTEPTAEIAAAVYAGMVCDTGGFRYNATAISTMQTAARLMDMGIAFTKIYNELMYQHRFVAGKILGVALANSQRVHNKKIVYTYITREMMDKENANPSDLDGVVEYLMGTRNALSAIFVYEKSGTTKVSLRSQGPNMGRVAAQLGGGGHALAAGANFNGTIEEALEISIKLAIQEIIAYECNK